MNPLLYLKGVVGAVGANVFPPLAEYAVSFTNAPPNVRSALSILIVALLTGGAIYSTPNQQSAQRSGIVPGLGADIDIARRIDDA